MHNYTFLGSRLCVSPSAAHACTESPEPPDVEELSYWSIWFITSSIETPLIMSHTNAIV